ncbi:response regulator [Aliiruegeria lutimaris]|uniref:Two-component system, OmpR family, response regulator BaeR n=1 Tax=Aliiruegeria lutimaris TaxID=571298 RepID=A0A1G8T2W7_9RHOB|nr:response regulator [Aliiruegeria lutimaris]SDJ35806.1 two-component system, OmpR family, response regulator BaeR [Aliiruegeria lutimaris]
MNTPSHILVVEDEPALSDILRQYLEQAGYRATILNAGTHATETILETAPDLVILDLMLPGKDGLTICREVRAKSDVPIIMETAKVEEIDRLLGLELGADDYMCKPFSPRELVARVRAILRRSAPRDAREQANPHGIVLDENSWRATVGDEPLDLTRREFQLLQVLHRRPGRVYSRSQLLDFAFPENAAIIDRTIDSHIKNIRHKIKAVSGDWDPIRSVYGVGYSYEE